MKVEVGNRVRLVDDPDYLGELTGALGVVTRVGETHAVVRVVLDRPPPQCPGHVDICDWYLELHDPKSKR